MTTSLLCLALLAGASPTPVFGEAGLSFVPDGSVPTRDAQERSTAAAVGVDGRGTLWMSFNQCLPDFTEPPLDAEELAATPGHDGIAEPVFADVDSNNGSGRIFGLSANPSPGFATAPLVFATATCRLVSFRGGPPFPQSVAEQNRTFLEDNVLPEDFPFAIATSFGEAARLCFLRGRPDPRFVECIDADAPTAPHPLFLDVDDIAGLVLPGGLGVRDAALGEGFADAVVPQRMRLREAIVVDNRAFGIFEIALATSPTAPVDATFFYLVEGDAAGGVTVRFGPHRQSGGPFTGLTFLGRERLLVVTHGPERSMITQRKAVLVDDNGLTLLSPYGQRLFVMPLDEDGFGTFDLVRPTLPFVQGGLDEPFINMSFIEAPAGALLDTRPEPQSIAPLTAWLSLDVDLNAGDGDKDGLTGADEATLGTSMWLRDSDADGIDDGIEVFVNDSDPTTQTALLGVPTPADRTTYGTLLGLRMSGPDVPPDPVGGALGDLMARLVTQPSAPAVLCGNGECRDVDGTIVVSGPADRTLGTAAPLFLTPAGDAVVFDDGLVIRRRPFGGSVNGDDDEVLTQSARVRTALFSPIDRLVPTSDGRVYAFAIETVIGLFGSIRSSNAIVVIDSDEVRPLFNPPFDPCGVDPQGCDPNDPLRVSELSELTHFVGYDPDGDVLYAVVATRDDIQLFAFVNEGPPTLVARHDSFQPIALNGTPGFVGPVRTLLLSSRGHFTEFFGTGINNGNLSGAFLVDRSLGLHEPMSDRGFAAGAHSAFGAGVVTRSSLLDEVVLEGAPAVPEVAAGDVLFWFKPFGLDAGDLGLMRVPPRGGSLPLLSSGRDVIDGIPTALGADENGVVCAVVDTGFAHGLFELSGSAPHAVPDQAVDLDYVDAVDCAYDRDGALVVLADAPPRIDRPRGGASVALTFPADGRTHTASQVIPRAGGGFYVTTFIEGGTVGATFDDVVGPLLCVDAGGAVAATSLAVGGLVESRDGRVFALHGDLLGIIEGDPCAGGAPAALALANVGTPAGSSILAARVLERPDGLLVVAPFMANVADALRPIAVDRRTAHKVTLAFETSSAAAALVPGAGDCDPWQDDRLGAPPLCRRGIFFDGDVTAPLPGDEPAVDDGGFDNAGGPGGCACGVVNARADVWWLGAIAGLGAWRRRRR